VRICRIESLEPGELCRIYSYPYWWQQAQSEIEPEEYLLRLSSLGKWQSVTHKYQRFELLRGDKISIVSLCGGIRVVE